MPKLTVTFSLDADADKDIVRWLEKQDNRSAAIRQALRAYDDRCVSLVDVYRELRELRRRLENGLIVFKNDNTPPDEPPDLSAALDNLGL